MSSYSLAVEERVDDAGLVHQIAASGAGSGDAEAELYRRLAPRVRLYGLRHLREPQAAADLVQEVLLTALEQIRGGKLRQPERLAGFVLGICRLVVLNQRRARARQARLIDMFGEDLPLSDPASAPRLDEARLRLCLERLSERERSVLVMTFYDDRSAAEVGAELGISEGNVRVIRHRGIERLRGCVEGRVA